MGHGAMQRLAGGGGPGGVIMAVTDLAYFPHDGSRQVLMRKTLIRRSEFNDPARVAVVNDIVARLRLKRMAEGDPWPETEAVAA